MTDPTGASRLFVAIWPTDAVIEVLAGLDFPPEPGVRPVPAENWHVTLRFLGDAFPDEVAERLAEVELPTATARLGPAVRRLGRNLLVVPVVGVDDLAAAVATATRGLGQPIRRDFFGHLTVARTRRDAPSAAIGQAVAADFAVTEVALVESDLTPQGAVYTTSARFATRPPEPG